jgi:hypothetical protein
MSDSEIKRLRLQNEKLRDLAHDAVAALDYIRLVHGELYGVGWQRVFEKAEAIEAEEANDGGPGEADLRGEVRHD